MLDNEAVIGKYQPHKIQIIKGRKKRVPDGEPIYGYFPAVVDNAAFYKAKRLRAERRIPTCRACFYHSSHQGLILISFEPFPEDGSRYSATVTDQPCLSE